MSDLKTRAKELLYELQTQDNRGTRTPIYYEIHSQRWEGYEERVGEEDAYFNPDSLHAIMGNTKITKHLEEWNDNGDLHEFDGDLDFEDDDQVEAIMAHMGYERKSGSLETGPDRAARIYLTEKEANQFIQNQRHNLDSNPQTYVKSAYDSPALKTLIEVLKEYVEVKE